MAILRSRHASFVSRIEGLAKSEIRAVTTGKNRIMIHGPKADGTYVVEFKTAAGAVLAISIPGSEAAVRASPSVELELGGLVRLAPAARPAAPKLQPLEPL
jgi:hypothetical protein